MNRCKASSIAGEWLAAFRLHHDAPGDRGTTHWLKLQVLRDVERLSNRSANRSAIH